MTSDSRVKDVDENHQSQYEYLKGTLSDRELDEAVALLKAVWPKAGFTFDYLDWLYRGNPVGPAETENAWDNGRIVGHYAAIPINATLFDKTEKGVFSLNTATHPSYRGKGFFKALASKTFENARASGATFVIGVANANSTLLFRRQLRFQLVTPLTVKLGLGAVRRIQKRPRHTDYTRVWDDPTLQWRLKRPNTKYVEVSRGTSTIILGDTDRYGIWTVMLDAEFARGTLAPKTGFRWNPFTLWIGLDPECDWTQSHYIDLPDFLKPSPLNLIFKDLSGLDRTLDPSKVTLSLLDFDAY